MKELRLVKAIVRYKTSPIRNREFVHGNPGKDDSTRYLLLQKAEDQNPENTGKWECPGGKIKSKETSIETLTREMTEEIGWKKEEFRVTKQLPTIRDCDVFLIDATSMNINLSSEHSDYRWVKAEDVKKQDLVEYADLLLEFFNNPKEYFN